MTGQEREQLKAELNKFNNVGDMIKLIYSRYDTHQPMNMINKNMIVNALVSSVSLLNLKKFTSK